jgi:hypothetical protein
MFRSAQRPPASLLLVNKLARECAAFIYYSQTLVGPATFAWSPQSCECAQFRWQFLLALTTKGRWINLYFRILCCPATPHPSCAPHLERATNGVERSQ